MTIMAIYTAGYLIITKIKSNPVKTTLVAFLDNSIMTGGTCS